MSDSETCEDVNANQTDSGTSEIEKNGKESSQEKVVTSESVHSEGLCESSNNTAPVAESVSDDLCKGVESLHISPVKDEKPSGSEADISDNPSSEQTPIHHLKWIQWNGKRTAIVTQNENGPCPLIAIANILLLRGKMILPINHRKVTASELTEFIADAIMSNVPKKLASATVLNYEQNVHDAMAVLPRLSTGLDVNIKFTGVKHFEYTPECIIFDLLNIPLYHGWLVDPQSEETVMALGSFGYNQVVERIIANKTSSDTNLVTEGLIAEEFLERTATQLTYHGLCELNSTMQQDELAVLFRNNHFSTILKKKNELFLLVTDQGFLHEPSVVWETLSNIDGDGQFVDSHFVTMPPVPTGKFEAEKSISQDQQISNDEELARQLQECERRESNIPLPEAQAQRPLSPGSPRPATHRPRRGMCTVL